MSFFFFQAEDGIRDLVRSRGLGDVYKRQDVTIDDRTDFGAMLDRARARIARRLREPGQIVDLSLIHI